MRKILLFAGLMIAGGVMVARYAEQVVGKPDVDRVLIAASTTAAPSPSAASAGSRTVTLQDDGRGHFLAEARVDGRRIDFLIDTGASMITLRESTAARLGFHPAPNDYTLRTQTANGIGRAAPVRLGMVEVGGIVVRDVPAFVLPDEALQVDLLGMTFLSRVRWTHDRGKLVLEQ